MDLQQKKRNNRFFFCLLFTKDFHFVIMFLGCDNMKIGIASDHRGYILKSKLLKYLKQKKFEVVDYGTANSKESVDYPDYAFILGEAVRDHKVDYGIAICGSGIGISIACNKVKGIRCAHVCSKKEAKMTRIDNDANVIAISGAISFIRACSIVNTFLTTPFSNEERHMRRINKISNYERNNDYDA